MKPSTPAGSDELGEIADRIECDLRRFDTIVARARDRDPVSPRAAAPGLFARVLARLRRSRRSRPIPDHDEDARFADIQRRLELIEERGAALLREAARHTANADEWERHAKLAIHAGDDGLAREALGRKREALDIAASLRRHAETVSA